MEKEQTCEQLIDSALADRLEQFRDAQADEQSMIDLLESVLSVEVRHETAFPITKILLSWGGPADWFDVWNADGTWIVRYVYEDWYDHADRELDPKDAKLVTDTFGHLFPIIN